MDFTKWYEILFYGPFVIGLLFLILMGSGMLPMSDTDADVGVDADTDFDNDLGASHHVGDIEQEGPGLIERALSVLGVGKVPISMLLVSLCFLWGFFGWASNRVLESSGFNLDWFGWISIVPAALLSLSCVNRLSRLMARFMPSTETSVQSERSFVGKRATARYPITDTGGAAMFTDANGEAQEVLCRVEPTQGNIPAGSKVTLIGYDEKRQLFYVRLDPLSQVQVS